VTGAMAAAAYMETLVRFGVAAVNVVVQSMT